MAGVVVWAYKNNRNLWTVYEPLVSCELERQYLLNTQQNVNLGTVSSSLSCYEVSFLHMTQTNIPSGSVREVKRIMCSHTSALGQGVVWEYEGDKPNQWTVYDVDTLNVIEDGFVRHNQMNMSVLDLQQSHVRLPYLIDFGRMTQMRVETGRIRRIQRRQLGQTFSPLATFTAGFSTQPALLSSAPSLSSASFVNSYGQSNWQPSPAAMKSQTTKSKSRHHPYAHTPASAPVVNGALNGSGAAAGLSSQVPLQTLQQQLQQQQLQLQQPAQNPPGPVTRRRHHQTSSTPVSATLQAHSHLQHPQMQAHPSLPQMYPGSHQSFYHQPLHQLHIQGSYQHLFGNLPVSGYQFPTSSAPLSVTSMGFMPPLAHQQIPRPASNSSLSSSSSTSSSMSVSGSQGAETLPTVFKVTISKSKKTKGKTRGVESLEKYMHGVDTDLDKNDCSICCEKLSEASSYGEGKAEAHAVVELNRCGHQFHKLCLLEMYHSIHKGGGLQCPSCKTIYGEKTGNCPPGYMQWRLVQDLTLPGYEGCGAILVSYHISPGIQGPDHPSPGHSFTARGFPRQGYLPDCDKGRKVLKLLMEAFQRRLMFTIATSHTTGEANTVTWNEIHHKTEPYGNHSGHGYPDPQYLDNVLMELAAHGVTEDCLR
ncbi:unnamed protein product [Candidula unifasciata]|uniref:E3 ubiquitin-protein ligase n=1 Tax=Candidula unifasciata TaxID=100452 RepID=A0A8S3YEX2_9EUPU|nr:unnamed protein product [Candidula unifasciata]